MSFLTDGTGVSALTGSKLLKDFVADALLTLVASFATANILNLQDAVQAPALTGFAIAGAVLHAGYRALMKWTSS